MNSDKNRNQSGRLALFSGIKGDAPLEEVIPVSEITDAIDQISRYQEGDNPPVLSSTIFEPVIIRIVESSKKMQECLEKNSNLQESLSDKENEIVSLKSNNELLSSEHEYYLNELINSHTEFDRALEIFQYHEKPMVLVGSNNTIHDANDTFCSLFSIARSEITKLHPPLDNYLSNEATITGPDGQRYSIIILTPPIVPFDHEAFSLLILTQEETPVIKIDLPDLRIPAFNQLPLPAAILNEHQTITMSNPAFCKLVGRTRESVDLRDIGSVGITFDHHESISEIIGDGKPRQANAVITLPDSEEINAYFELYKIPENDENIAILIVGDKISEETDSDDDRKENIIFQILLDLNPAATALIDEHAKVIFSNEGFSEITGLSSQDLTGIDVRDLGVTVPEDSLSTGATEVVFIPEPIRMKSVWGETESSVMIVPVGSLLSGVAAVLILQPILQESKKEPEEIENIKEKTFLPEDFLISMPIPGMIRDVSGNLIKVNDAFLAWTGLDSDSLFLQKPDQYLIKLSADLVQFTFSAGIYTCREMIMDYPGDSEKSLSWFFDLSQETNVIDELKSKISDLETELKERIAVFSSETTQVTTNMQKIGEDIDIVEFELNEEQYAIDITMVREVVEMLPITPLPKTPPYVIGIVNLRGEVTHIIDLAILLGQRAKKDRTSQKIIIIPSDVTNGEHVGIIVDNVQSVTEIQGKQVSLLGNDITDQIQTHIKGIIKITHDDILEKHTDGINQVTLVIWLDIQKILHEIQV